MESEILRWHFKIVIVVICNYFIITQITEYSQHTITYVNACLMLSEISTDKLKEIWLYQR